jgi:peptidylprolyl isomerase
MTTPTTYDKKITSPGSGAGIQQGQRVTVHCTGFGKNGDLSSKFWSTKDPGQEPFTFQVGMGQVIKCWDEGVLTMKIGEKATLTCSPEYGYGM